MQYHQKLSVALRRCVKEEHCFIPYGKFSAWYITTLSPSVRFTLDKNLLFFITKIEGMRFLSRNADRD